MKNFGKGVRSVCVGLGLLALLAGCSKKDQASSQSAAAAETTTSAAAVGTSQEEAAEKQKVVVATFGNPIPYTYVDENNELKGYDIDVLREIFSRLPQYELEFKITDFDSIFSGLDAGYYQIGANTFGFKKDRVEKYIFSDCYSVGVRAILVRKDNTDINSVYDLAGHSTESLPGNLNSTIYETYNEAHPDNPIQLNYVEKDDQTPFKISEGQLDFEYFDKVTLQQQVEEYGLTDELKLIDVPIDDMIDFNGSLAGSFYLLPKGYDQLAADMNEALEAAVADGSIHKLRVEYFEQSDDDPLTLEYIEYARKYIADQQ
jgi:polar amino acid transport system substrate-binding protein